MKFLVFIAEDSVLYKASLPTCLQFLPSFPLSPFLVFLTNKLDFSSTKESRLLQILGYKALARFLFYCSTAEMLLGGSTDNTGLEPERKHWPRRTKAPDLNSPDLCSELITVVCM